MKPRITYLAAGHLRDAIKAQARGDTAEAMRSLMCIDPLSWRLMQERMAELGGGPLSDILPGVGDGTD